MYGTPHPQRQGDEAVPVSLPRRFLRLRFLIPAVLVIGLATLTRPSIQLAADNFVFYLPSGHHMIPRGQLHWVFAFGHEGRYVLVHDPAALRQADGEFNEPETYAVPWPAFARMARVGRDRLSAAILIRKGARP